MSFQYILLLLNRFSIDFDLIFQYHAQQKVKQGVYPYKHKTYSI